MTQLSSLFNTGKGSNYRYCDRGDPSDFDWEIGDLTTDASYHDLDCSSIAPSDAVAFIIRCQVKDDAAGKYMLFKNKDNTNYYTGGAIWTQVANVMVEDVFIISCDENQTIQYMASNTTFTTINISVVGWYIESGTSGGDVLSNANIGDNKLIRGDGGTKHIQQCSTITVTDDGEMVNTGQPAFCLELTNDLTNATGDGTSVSMTGAIWTEIYDQGNNVSNGIFTAPVDGKYRFSYIVLMAGLLAAHTRFYAAFISSNKTFYPNQLNPWEMHYSSSTLMINGSIDLEMDADDTFYLLLCVDNGTKVVDFIDEHTILTGALIC